MGADSMNYDDFITRWYLTHFVGADTPKWNDKITCADASELLRKFHRALKKEASLSLQGRKQEK